MPRQRRCSKQAISVLSVLVESSRKWRHGYEITKETGLQSGTLYPILMRLSDRGMLDSKWQPSLQANLPPRHMYKLTANGIKYAREQLEISADNELLDNALTKYP